MAVIQREVTFTKVVFAWLATDGNGDLVARKEEEILAGNLNVEKATRELSKQYGLGVQVLDVQPDTKRYQMDVTQFIKLAEEVKEKVEA